jgi:hypothetical protein
VLYLIDGYNLLYALGVVRKQMGPGRLEAARLRLLGLLKAAHGDDAASVTVVFDAHNAPAGAAAEADYRGLRVRFAVGEAQADDLIEQLIRRASVPRRLTVVSDDHRIQKAARRRRCVVRGCGDYLDWLERRRRKPAPPPKGDAEASKPAGVSGEEARHWLSEFADLADDPDLKELFDPHGFLDEGEG